MSARIWRTRRNKTPPYKPPYRNLTEMIEATRIKVESPPFPWETFLTAEPFVVTQWDDFHPRPEPPLVILDDVTPWTPERENIFREWLAANTPPKGTP